MTHDDRASCVRKLASCITSPWAAAADHKCRAVFACIDAEPTSACCRAHSARCTQSAWFFVKARHESGGAVLRTLPLDPVRRLTLQEACNEARFDDGCALRVLSFALAPFGAKRVPHYMKRDAEARRREARARGKSD